MSEISGEDNYGNALGIQTHNTCNNKRDPHSEGHSRKNHQSQRPTKLHARKKLLGDFHRKLTITSEQNHTQCSDWVPTPHPITKI